MKSGSEPRQLADESVGIYPAPEGAEEGEFVEPGETLTEAGADVEVVGPETGEAQTVNSDLDESDTDEVEREVSETSADEYDALVVLAGTVGADELRSDDDGLVTTRKPDDLEAVVEEFADAGA